MAYLKGNTYVDGDLYIDGSLKVKRLLDTSSLNLPYLKDENSSVTNRLVRFITEDGALTYSPVEETIDETQTDTIKYTYTLSPLDTQKTKTTSIYFKNLNLYLKEIPKITIDTPIHQFWVKHDDTTSELIFLIAVGTSLQEQNMGHILNKDDKIVASETNPVIYRETVTDFSGQPKIVEYVKFPEKPSTWPDREPYFRPQRVIYKNHTIPVEE